MASQVAEAFAGARGSGAALDALPAVASQQQALEVQRVFLENTGLHGLGPKIGWKCAAITAKAVKSMGLDGPGRAPIFAASRFRSGATVPNGPASTPGSFFVVEAEFGFVMKDALPRRAQPYTAAEVWAAVDGMVPCFELVGSRASRAAMGKQSGPQFLADLGLNWGVVVGPKIGKAALPPALGPNVDGEQTKTVPVELIRNGEVVAKGTAADNVAEGPRGSGPFLSLLWLANHLASGPYGGVLDAGDVVIPGAAAITRKCAHGDHFVARFGGLGTVEMTVGSGSAASPTLLSRL